MADLAAKDPENSTWQESLAGAHELVGLLFMKRYVNEHMVEGYDFSGAIAAFREAIRIREMLCAKDPSNQQWRQDLATSHSLVGEVRKYQGDFDAALEAFAASKATMESLVSKNPTNAHWQSSLADMHMQMAGILLARSDFDTAITEYGAAHAIIDLLSQQDPNNIYFQRHLTESHEGIGNALQGKGDIPGAVEYYRRAQVVLEGLSSRHQVDLSDLARLSLAHAKIGILLYQQRDIEGALAAAWRSQEIMERLITQEPGNRQWQESLRTTLYFSILVLRQQPTTVENAKYLAAKLGSLSWCYLLMGEFAEARAAATAGYSRDQQPWILMNLAHAEMFLGNEKVAKSIHLRYRYSASVNSVAWKEWAESARGDFAALKNAGMASPLMADIDNILAEPR